MNIFTNYPLRIAIPLFLFVIAIIINVYSMIGSLRMSDVEVENSGMMFVTQEMSQLQGTVNSFLQEGNVEGTQIAIANRGSNPNTEFVVLADENNVVVHATRVEFPGLPIQQAAPEIDTDLINHAKKTMSGKAFLSKNRDSIFAYYPVVIGAIQHEVRPSLVGILFMQYDLTNAKAAHRYEIEQNMWHSVVFYFLLFLSLGIFLYYALTKRMLRLVAAAKRFASGDESARSGLKGKDEIAQAGEAFDNMAEIITKDKDLLRKSEEKFRALFESAKDGIVHLTTDGKVIALNTSFASIHGYSVDEMLKMNLKDLDTPESTQMAPERFKRMFEGEPMLFEVEHYCKNGQTIPLEVSANMVIIGDEKYILGFHRDISKRKKAEEALKKREEQYRTLVENIPDYVMQYDRQHRHIFANSKTLRDNKMTAEEFIGKTHSELGFDPYLCDIWEKAIDKIFETGRPQMEVFEWRSPVGVKVLEWRAYPEYAPDGSIESVLGISRDITEQKQAEDKMRDSFVYTRRLIETSLDPLVTISADGKITDVNEATIRVTGISRERLIGTDFTSYFTEPEKAQEGYLQVFEKGFVKDYPLVIRHISGSITEVMYNASVYKDIEDNVTGIFAAARDITERKRTEAERERLINELKEAIANVKTLSGMLPICASCKKIRDDNGYWSGVESYITEHSGVLFSHGICPECAKKMYEELEKLKNWNA